VSFGDLTYVVAVFVIAGMLSGFVRYVVRYLLRRLVRGSRPVRAWVRRLPRGASETANAALARRRQRADAVAAILSRIASTLILITAILVALHRADVALLPVVSGAGFIGAAFSIGGQHVIHDYLNGFLFLVEDRLSEGDEITVTLDGKEVTGVVERVGSYAVRLTDGDTTWHVANRELTRLRNHSQRPGTTKLSVRVGPSDIATSELVALAQQVVEDSPGIGPVVIQPGGHDQPLKVRSRVPISDARAAELSRAIEEELDERR